MIKKTTTHQLNSLSRSRLEHFGSLSDLLIFDIETTGFIRQKDTIISITTMSFTPTTIESIQWFAEMPSEELQLLLEASVLFNEKPLHMTYNGHTFDIPFLNYKYQYYNIYAGLNKSKTYDLYRICRQVLRLDSYKLKSIEKALGIYRSDEISGKDCIELYQAYLKGSRQEAPELILLHNYEDVLNLIDLSIVIDHSQEGIKPFQLHYLHTDKINYYLSQYDFKEEYATLKFIGLPTLPNHTFRQLSFEHFYANGEHIVSQIESGSHHLEVRILINSTVYEGLSFTLFHPHSKLILETSPELALSPTDSLISFENVLEHTGLNHFLHALLIKFSLSE